MGRPPRSEARDTRREILDAALDLFAERGYHATSTRALAAAVGVRESALYHHFPSKEAVLMAILEENAQLRVQMLQEHARLLDDLSLEDLLSLLMQRMLELLSDPRQRKFMRFALAAGPNLIGDVQTPWFAVIEGPRRALQQIFGRLRKAGSIRGDVEFEIFLTHLVAPMILATNVLWGEGRGPISMPIRRFAREHVAFLVAALSPPARSAR